MDRNTRLFVAGHRGMAGRAILRRLQNEGFKQIVTRRHAELDLTDQAAVNRFFEEHPVDQVVLAAARVGGIQANNRFPADFIYQNLMIEANVIQAAYLAGVRRLLFLGSSCIYPKHAGQPLKEEALLGGWLEPTNEPYAVAKIAGIKLCESYNRQYGTDYRSVMPTNLYGPGDNADEARHGPIPKNIRHSLGNPRNASAPRVILWGSGRPFREFLHVDDLAAACLFVMGQSCEALTRLAAPRPEADREAVPVPDHNLRPETCLLNVGTGRDLTIRELAETVAGVVGFDGQIVWDAEKPDGTPRKQLDTSRLTQLGWKPRIGLREGIRRTYRDYLKG